MSVYEQYKQFMRNLFAPTDTICFTFIAKDQPTKHTFAPAEDAFKEGTFRDLQKYNEIYNIFIAMNPFKPELIGRHDGRTKENVGVVKRLYADADKDGDSVLAKIQASAVVPPPNVTLNTSPGKYQFIWNVDGLSQDTAEVLLKAIAREFETDPAVAEVARVLRIPGFKNRKYADAPEVTVVGDIETEVFKPVDFSCLRIEPANAKTEPVNAPPRLVEVGSIHLWMLSVAGKLRDAGLTPAEIEPILRRRVHEECETPPNGFDDSKIVAMARSMSKYPAGVNTDLLLTQTPTQPPAPGVLESSAERLSHDTDGDSETSIPPFDPSVITGIYKRFVDVATKGTTLAPQFVYGISKTIVGAKMAGNVKFEDLDVEPLDYFAMGGETGTGKGESWRRILKILLAEGVLGGSGIKVINSADSGAGLKDAFFEPPEDHPILCYIDEVKSVGHKAAEKKNPEIIDVMGELADSTSISRTKAKKGKQPSTKTKNDAYLAVVMCGQNSEVYTTAFTGRTGIGWFDRLTPEYGVPVEPGDLPPIDRVEAMKLLVELNSLKYSGTMTTSPEAKAILNDFWVTQPIEIRTVVRLKKGLRLDAYRIAFGRGVMVVEKPDIEAAIKCFIRQSAIRRMLFKGEAPNRVGFYLGLIKELTEWMRQRLAAGVPPGDVARSWRDYEHKTNARRNNEEDIFGRAMETHAKHHLEKVQVKGKNGRMYSRYLPVPED